MNTYETGTDVETENAVPRVFRESTSVPLLVTRVEHFSKTLVTMPVEIMADANREYLGFFPHTSGGTSELTPQGAGVGAFIQLNPNIGPYEMRLSSHGEFMRGSFVLDSNFGGECTVITMTRVGR